jgi:RNA polymerase sigma factor (sigma-70 family)
LSPLALSLRFLQTQSDAQLAKLAGEGHERAFEALVGRYRKPLLAYCQRLSPAEISAEDTLQQALLQAWTAIRTGVEVRDPRAWLYRIVHNVAISSRRRRLVIPLDLPEAAATDGADHQAEQRMAARETLERLASLPKMQREVMVGTAVDGLSHEQLASALGLSSGAVRGLIYRARATLRTAAAALLPGPLIGWTIRNAGGTRASGLVEALAGGGSAGLGDFLFKGGAIAATAGAIATAGITIDPDAHRHHAVARHVGAQERQLATPRAKPPASVSTRILVAERLRPGRQAPHGQTIERGDRHERDRGRLDQRGSGHGRLDQPGPGHGPDERGRGPSGADDASSRSARPAKGSDDRGGRPGGGGGARGGAPALSRHPADTSASATGSSGHGSSGPAGGLRNTDGRDVQGDPRLPTAGTPLLATPDDEGQLGGGSGSAASGGPRATATGQVTMTSTTDGGKASGRGHGSSGGSAGGGNGSSGGSPGGGDESSGGSPGGPGG